MRNLTTIMGFLAGEVVLCGFVAGSGDAQAPSPGFKPVASVRGLMNGQGLVFTELQELVANPKAKDRGEHLVGLAEALAELANVNTYNKDKEDYRKWAGRVRDACLELANEGKKTPPDEAQLAALLKRVKDTCTSCHDVYQ